MAQSQSGQIGARPVRRRRWRGVGWPAHPDRGLIRPGQQGGTGQGWLARVLHPDWGGRLIVDQQPGRGAMGIWPVGSVPHWSGGADLGCGPVGGGTAGGWPLSPALKWGGGGHLWQQSGAGSAGQEGLWAIRGGAGQSEVGPV